MSSRATECEHVCQDLLVKKLKEEVRKATAEADAAELQRETARIFHEHVKTRANEDKSVFELKTNGNGGLA